MRKKITVRWLRSIGACKEAIEAFSEQSVTDPTKILKILLKKEPDWGNWLIVRLMTYRQYVAYAIYAAEEVIGIYERKYPKNDYPRKAIEAAKKCLRSPMRKNNLAERTVATEVIPSSRICVNTPSAWGSPRASLGQISMR